MREQLASLLCSAKERIAAAEHTQALEEVRLHFLGKKGVLTAILKQMGGLPPEERPLLGQLANDVRGEMEQLLQQRGGALKSAETEARLLAETIDVTLPGTRRPVGHKHPLSIVLDEVREIFLGLGFSVATGPEIEWDYYNFEALNMPKGHPARDTQDTFYISETMLLRTQTSPVQVRAMEQHGAPLRVIAPGRVYRSDAVDATHSPIFHQIEGLVVDQHVTMANLKHTLNLLARRLFGEDTRTRFRPHHFSFTEPSCEVDVSCFRCGGSGCGFCKGEGWVEILGAGMVHPKVLRAGGIDPEVYSGFAFGLGLERLVLFRFQIDDMRLLYENDLRFLHQF